MSVDLVGSTAFKAHKDYSEPQNGSALPGWVNEFRAFYQEFPIAVANSYDLVVKAFGDELQSELSNTPRVWKNIGDEIIFCGRVRSVEHTAACVSAFLKALEQYSKRLEEDKKPLRLKGAGWLAAFPAPNITIAVAPNSLDSRKDIASTPSENEEEFEQNADEIPSRFDFLGKGIDTGFRISKNASEDRFVTSVQLGYVLSRAAIKKSFPHSFGYHGRETLKGVIDGAPYPIVSVDTERSEIKSTLKSREAALTSETTVKSHALFDFLETFMSVANIDKPCLGEGTTKWQDNFPESYLRYQKAFEDQLKIDTENVNQVKDACDPETPNEHSLDQPKSFLDKFASLSEDSAHSETAIEPKRSTDKGDTAPRRRSAQKKK